MPAFPDPSTFRDLIRLARDEDLADGGAVSADVTSRLLVGEGTVGVGTFVQRGPGVICGLPLIEHVAAAFDERLRVEPIPGFHFEILEGRFNDSAAMPLVRVRGPMRSLLAFERTALNFLGHLGGIATLTHQFARRCEGTAAKIYDTRKTLPGMRSLAKYAVRCGGGMNHRAGLHDMVLAKDNHLAGVAVRDLADFLRRVLRDAPAGVPVEVEVDTTDQLREVLAVDGLDVVLLDNMDCPQMERAVALRQELRPDPSNRPALEASGGVTLQTVREIARTGVERVAVGAITHSAPALDVALDVEPE